MDYRIPYIDKSQKSGLSFRAYYAQNKTLNYDIVDHKNVFFDTDELTRESVFTGVSYVRRNNFYNFHNIGLSFNYSSISDTIVSLNPHYLLDGQNDLRFFRLNYIFRRDRRDFVAYPLQGFLLRLEAEKVGLGIFDGVDRLELSANYLKYLELKNNFYFSTHFGGTISTPKRQAYINRNGIGFRPNMVRGYELYVITGQNFAFNKTTFKKLLFKGEADIGRVVRLKQFRKVPYAFYLKGYFDSGIVHNDLSDSENERLTNKFIYGTGIGLDIVSFYDVVFKLEYSVNKEGESGFFLNFRSNL